MADRHWEELSRLIALSREQWIREAAYYNWVNAGMPQGDGSRFWTEAVDQFASHMANILRQMPIIPDIAESPNIPTGPNVPTIDGHWDSFIVAGDKISIPSSIKLGVGKVPDEICVGV